MPKRERRPFSDEVLRERAVTMAELGHSQRTIAAALGVHKNTVSRWLIAWRTSGAAALKPHRRGRRPQEQMLVSPAQAAEIQQLITEHCPDRLGLSFALGPGSRAGSDPVRDLIRKRYGLTLAIRTVGDYLRFTPQRPVKRALERQDARIRSAPRRKAPKSTEAMRPGCQTRPTTAGVSRRRGRPR